MCEGAPDDMGVCVPRVLGQPGACPGEVLPAPAGPSPRPFLRSSGPTGRTRGPGWVCRLAGTLSLRHQPHGGHVPLASGWPPGRSQCLCRCLWESRSLPPAPHCSAASPLGHFTPSPDPCNSAQHSRAAAPCAAGASLRTKLGQNGPPLALAPGVARPTAPWRGQARARTPLPPEPRCQHLVVTAPGARGTPHPLPEGPLAAGAWAGDGAPGPWGRGAGEGAPRALGKGCWPWLQRPAHVRGAGGRPHHGGLERNQSPRARSPCGETPQK